MVLSPRIDFALPPLPRSPAKLPPIGATLEPPNSFIEEDYRLIFPIRESNLPKGLSKMDILAIEELVSTKLKSHEFSQLYYPKECFVTRYEDGFKINRKGGPAVIYYRGSGEYWIRGRKLPDHLTERLFKYNHYKMSIIDVLSHPNIEERRDMMECLSSDQLAKMMEHLLMPIHSDYLNNRLYTLYKTRELINMEGYYSFDMYFIHVRDASTSREYYIQVPPMTNALEALAWTFYETKTTYNPIIET